MDYNSFPPATEERADQVFAWFTTRLLSLPDDQQLRYARAAAVHLARALQVHGMADAVAAAGGPEISEAVARVITDSTEDDFSPPPRGSAPSKPHASKSVAFDCDAPSHSRTAKTSSTSSAALLCQRGPRAGCTCFSASLPTSAAPGPSVLTPWHASEKSPWLLIHTCMCGGDASAWPDCRPPRRTKKRWRAGSRGPTRGTSFLEGYDVPFRAEGF